MSDDMTSRMTDEIRLRALMTAYQAGDLAAFEQLYVVVAPAVRRWLRGHARDAAETDDLIQETFLQIHRARHTYDAAYPIPARLRAAVAADLAAVRPLARPVARAIALAPLALLLLLAAPLVFQFRNLEPLGWAWSWGASIVQAGAGLALVAAALREAIPGRAWSHAALAALAIAPFAWLVAITFASWHASPVVLSRQSWAIGVICLVSSAATALPAVVLGSVLALRATGRIGSRPDGRCRLALVL